MLEATLLIFEETSLFSQTQFPPIPTARSRTKIDAAIFLRFNFFFLIFSSGIRPEISG